MSFLICFLTFAIYIGSAIYTAGEAGVAQQFGVSSTVATLGLTLFVFGYGIGEVDIPKPPVMPARTVYGAKSGPMFLAPVAEAPPYWSDHRVSNNSLPVCHLELWCHLRVGLQQYCYPVVTFDNEQHEHWHAPCFSLPHRLHWLTYPCNWRCFACGYLVTSNNVLCGGDMGYFRCLRSSNG